MSNKIFTLFNKVRTNKKQKTDQTGIDSDYIRKITLSFSMILLIILLLGFVLYSVSINSISDNYWNQEKTILKSSVDNLDNSFRQMDILCGEIVSSNVSGLSILSPKDPDFYYKSYLAKRELKLYLSSERYMPIYSYYIYMGNNDYIISSSQLTSGKSFYTESRSYRKDRYSAWYDLMHTSPERRTFINMSPFTKLNTPSTRIYMLALDRYTTKKTNALAVFEIDDKKISEIFDPVKITGNGFMVMTDSSGQNVLSKGMPDDFTRDMSKLSYDKNGYSNMTYNGSSMHVTAYISPYNGWNCYLVTPMNASSTMLIRSRLIFSAFTMLAIVISYIYMTFVIKRAARPVLSIRSKLNEAHEKNSDLQKALDDDRPLLYSTYTRRLLTGLLTSEADINYAKDFLGLSDGKHYAVIYAVIYDNEYMENYAGEDMAAIDAKPYFTYASLEEDYASFLGDSLLSFRPNEHSIAFIFKTDKSPDDGMMEAQKKILDLHNYLLETYSIWLFAGLGEFTDNPDTLWSSYNHAFEATNYTSKNYIFLPYAMIKKHSNVYYFPAELSARLISCVVHGESEQTTKIFAQIRKENIEERSLSVNLLKFLASDIRNSLLKARNQIKESDENKTVLVEADELFSEKLSISSCEKIAEKLIAASAASSRNEDDLIKEIRNYIDNNFADASLGLSKISDEFKISESYFSHLFKDRTGVNFSVYLENIRMKKSVELINRNPDINTNDLFIKVGYNNANSFRRVFKKTYDMTPSQMKASLTAGNPEKEKIVK